MRFELKSFISILMLSNILKMRNQEKIQCKCRKLNEQEKKVKFLLNYFFDKNKT
jgi:hypothetical protein